MLQRLLHIRPDERLKVLLLFLYAFGTAAAYVVSRAVADGIFLSRVGPQYLPLMYAASAVAVILVSLVYSRQVRCHSLPRVIGASLLLLAGATCAIPGVLSLLGDSLALVAPIYVLAEVRGALGTIQFTSLINESFRPDDAKRVYGVIGFGATLAGILFGGLVGLEAYEIGAANLLYVAAGLEVAVIVPLQWLGRYLQDPRENPTSMGEPAIPSALAPGMWRTVAHNPLVRGLALLVLLKVAVAFIIEFEWKLAVTHTFETQAAVESAMTRYFGLFYAVVYLSTAVLQLLATSRLLKHFDLAVALLAFPSALLTGTVVVIAWPGSLVPLWPTTFLKGCDALKRSIQAPAEQLLFTAITPGVQRQAVALVNGVVKPAAEIGSSLVILPIYLLLPEEMLGYAVVFLIVAWLVVSLGCRRTYAQSEIAEEAAVMVPNDTEM